MLKNFLTHIYDDNMEMNAIIDSEQPEFDLLSEKMRNAFDDNFPIEATDDGILRWEKIFGIVTNPAEESTDFRRARILKRLVGNIPFTERNLIEIVNEIVGVGKWEYTLDYENYTLTIQSTRPGKGWLNELLITLQNIIPVNIFWKVNLYSASWQNVKDDYATWGSMINKTWDEIREGI